MDRRIKLDEAPAADDDENIIYVAIGNHDCKTPADIDAIENSSAPWPPGLPVLMFIDADTGELEYSEDWQVYFDHKPRPWECKQLIQELLALYDGANK